MLIDEAENDAVLLRKNQRKEQNDASGHYRIYNYYNSTPRRNFELFLMELDVGTENTSVGHSEKSQEYLVVVEGNLCLKTGGKEYNLKEEDSISFNSAKPHTYINIGDCVSKSILVNYYPG